MGARFPTFIASVYIIYIINDIIYHPASTIPSTYIYIYVGIDYLPTCTANGVHRDRYATSHERKRDFIQFVFYGARAQNHVF